MNLFFGLILSFFFLQNPKKLEPKEVQFIKIASTTAQGKTDQLKLEITKGLEAGLTVNQIKEAIVHVYAYAGFPRSIRGLQTFMQVLDQRKSQGISDKVGVEANQISNELDKYTRGKKVLEELRGMPEPAVKTGYSAFAPVMDTFLKEHLFADIFERDVLNYRERELLTIAIVGSLGNLEPMLESHLKICLQIGISPSELRHFSETLKPLIKKEDSEMVQKVLENVLKQP